MKKIIILLIMILFIVNCTSEKYKTRLIGEWYYENDAKQSLRFENDSLWINSNMRTVQTWSADANHIKLYNKLDTTFYNNEFIYNLRQDTLEWKTLKDTSRLYRFIRIKDKYEYYQKTIDLNIDLPIAKNLKPINSKYSSPDIFIVSENGEIVMNDYSVNFGIEYFFTFLVKYKSRPNEDEFNNEFVFNIYADKNITNVQMDTIMMKLKQMEFDRVFRIYKNDSINYRNNLNWYGKYE